MGGEKCESHSMIHERKKGKRNSVKSHPTFLEICRLNLFVEGGDDERLRFSYFVTVIAEKITFLFINFCGFFTSLI